MQNLTIAKSKIFDEHHFQSKRQVWRFRQQKVVFTNGCFDVLHLGHIHYLANAADLGDCLVIGLNTDRSVRQLKGEGRPVKDQETRSMLLASLHFVDGVLLYDEESPLELIRFAEPDVLVKGSDYPKKDIVGADHVESYGGEVRTIDFLEGHSSSDLIKAIQAGE